MSSTKEPQYNCCFDLIKDEGGRQQFGLMSNYTWSCDPKRLLFLLSRYKFVSKMFSGYDHVTEVGCADAFGTRIIAREVNRLTALDYDPVFIEDANDYKDKKSNITCLVHDMVAKSFEDLADGIFSMDVLEHIPKADEKAFLNNIKQSLKKDGVLIIGTPSLNSQEYASEESKIGHVNCKDQNQLKVLLECYFNNVFIFSMNDEVVHTGFSPMAHYYLALCCSPT